MMSEVIHPYLQTTQPDRLCFKPKEPNRFFDGPVDGTVLQELPLNYREKAGEASEQIEATINLRLQHYIDSLSVMESYGIRTVRPVYMISQREVADKNGFYSPEKVIVIIADKIEAAVTYNDVLAGGREVEALAYDNLAIRLLSMLRSEYVSGNAVESEIMRLSQFVVDPTASRIEDKTVMVDVEPIERLRYETVLQSVSVSILDITREVVRLAKRYGLERMSSVRVVQDTIQALPYLYCAPHVDVRQPVLDAIAALDDERIDYLAFEGPAVN